jgi:hypothetical protein
MLASALAMGVLMHPPLVEARKQGEYRYPFDRVWNTALRMVRVDMRLPVTDRDAEAGYLLFDYMDHGRRFPGSIELVKRERNDQPVITAVIQVQGMPSYVEQMMLDKLEKKLKDEVGEPLEPKKPPAEKPKEPEKKPDPGKEGEAPPGSDDPAPILDSFDKKLGSTSQ